MVVCEFCKREFKSKYAYYAHKCDGYLKERQEIKNKKEEENNNGNFVCNGCGKHFAKATSLKSHARFCKNYTPKNKYDENGNYISSSKYKKGDIYECECGRQFDNPQSLNGHLSFCEYHHKCVGTVRKLKYSEIHHSNGWEKLSKEEISEITKKSAKTTQEKIKSGELKNAWIGKHHTKKSKELHRKAAIEYRKKLLKISGPSYNLKGCEYIDKLNETKGWHLQHAENGGEVEIGGYFLDGYDKELNIAFEYDEPNHYKDVYNNILKDKDIERQNYIINELNCKFYRYNEKLDLLYEINN